MTLTAGLLEPFGPGLEAALAVVAHPDDESFGLGAILAGLVARGVRVRVLCFTHGEASTLGATEGELGKVRRRELERAAAQLGIEEVRLLGYPDGRLAHIPRDRLVAEVERLLGDAEVLVVFEPGGVTGHPDHRAATAAAQVVAERHCLGVLEWGLPSDVAASLNRQFNTEFTSSGGIDVEVDRTAQWCAIRCHASQANDNPVLRRRLELLGDRERVRLLPPGATPAPGSGHVSESGQGGTFAPTPSL